MSAPFIACREGSSPLLVSLPHTGTVIPEAIERRLVSPWLARKDTDWWVDRLYDFAGDLGATVIRTALSRTVIDVNRDPSGASLYPGQATTGLCPLTTFDGEPLYRHGEEPDDTEIEERRRACFDPYHRTLDEQIARLRARHRAVIVYDCHSIRSVVPRLFDAELPHFNIGTNGGGSCAPVVERLVENACAASGFASVLNGRFKGGWITRHLGRPADGIHAVQIELACRAYMDEPATPTPDAWPTPYDPERAAPVRATLQALFLSLVACAHTLARTQP